VTPGRGIRGECFPLETARISTEDGAGIPAGALAAKPSHPSTPSQTKTVTTNGTTTTVPANTKGLSAKVMFVIHGAVAAYAPVVGQANGSIRDEDHAA